MVRITICLLAGALLAGCSSNNNAPAKVSTMAPPVVTVPATQTATKPPATQAVPALSATTGAPPASATRALPATQTADSAPCLAGQIKGNRDSKIYHLPTGRDYAKTMANVACFDTEQQAQAAGYRKADQ